MIVATLLTPVKLDANLAGCPQETFETGIRKNGGVVSGKSDLV